MAADKAAGPSDAAAAREGGREAVGNADDAAAAAAAGAEWDWRRESLAEEARCNAT